MDKINRLELARWASKTALKYGATETNVSISNQRDVEIEYRDKKIEKLQESIQNSLYIQIYADSRYAGYNTNDLRKESLEKFIEEAVKSTMYLSKDEFRKLIDPKYFQKNLNYNLEINDLEYKNVEPEQRIKIVEEIEAAAMAVSDKIISSSANYSDTHYNTVRVLSNGFEGESEGTYFSAGANVTVKDKDARPEDWFFANTRFKKDLPSASYLGKKAAEGALQKIGQAKIASGKYQMLVMNRSCGNLINTITGAMGGRAIQQKASFLDGMIGKKIASELLTLIDDPLLKSGMSSRLYDSDGIAAQRLVMIEKGVLKHYYIGNYYGKKLNMEPTSGGTSNLLFDYGTKSLEQLTREMNKGILVTSFIGGNSNSTTGDFSFGVMGLLIENGAIVKPVNELNISGNAKEFWNQLVVVGNDPYIYSGWRIPSMLFDGVAFSGL